MEKNIENNKINFGKIADLFQWAIVILLVFTSISLALSNFDNPLKLRVYSVNSGSMRPEINVGSLVFVRPQVQYFIDDVITYGDRNDIKSTTTHRITDISVDEDLGISTLTTKGDANEDPDPFKIRSTQIIGKVVFKVPLIGYLVAFAKTQIGFILLVIIPATLLIYTEFTNIKEEVIGIINDRKKKSEKTTKGTKPKQKGTPSAPVKTIKKGKVVPKKTGNKSTKKKTTKSTKKK